MGVEHDRSRPGDSGQDRSRDGGSGRVQGGGWDPDRWRAFGADALAFVRRRLTGDYTVDEYGFDRHLTDDLLLPALRPLFHDWFRTEVRGIDQLPESGALVVANHSGTFPLDGVMAQVAVAESDPYQRHLRLLGADLVFRLPVVSMLARSSGTTLACGADVRRLLTSGELVAVFPEGFKGLGKQYSERYRLQRFGRGGFVTAALRSGVPIVPCAIVGAEEAYPMLANAEPLARLLGLPYLPITPTFPWLGPFGLVPLPSKWMIEFGTPIATQDYPPDAADDPTLVMDLTDHVRGTVQRMLHHLLLERG